VPNQRLKLTVAAIVHPLMHPVVFADICKGVVRRFPYCVFYRPHQDRVEVIAVFHTSSETRIIVESRVTPG